VTYPKLQPRTSVSAKTLLVICFMVCLRLARI